MSAIVNRRPQKTRLASKGRLAGLIAVLAALAAGCGGSKQQSAPPTTPSQPQTSAPKPSRSTTTSSATGPNALQAEANATSAGDIPDNQVFIVFVDRAAGYSTKYPEGWAQQGTGRRVTFRDKNNIVRIVVVSGPAPTKTSVRADVARLGAARAQGGPVALSISGKPAYRAVYSTLSAPNAVTGKRVTLVVDRYYLWHGNRYAVVDLGTPQGVDNVDAYRLMIESFRWK